ncbi:hypothetical protein BBJ28_00007711 [Nothophytophthora sp. Chile5]|nr:hypothetical protein BBJ28_00007711 [Nothophytophthora sp. Chile5]
MGRGGLHALRALRQWPAYPAGAYGRVTTTRPLSTHVSVIGLHWKTDETRLREAFAGFGKLEKARIVTPDHSNRHLWASLVYSSFNEAFEAASEMNGQELDGRLLRVSIVDPPTEGDDPAAASSTKYE